jgi:hypothetical protein
VPMRVLFKPFDRVPDPMCRALSLAFEGNIWKVDPATGTGEMVASPTPRALDRDRIRGINADFRRAAGDRRKNHPIPETGVDVAGRCDDRHPGA